MTRETPRGPLRVQGAVAGRLDPLSSSATRTVLAVLVALSAPCTTSAQATVAAARLIADLTGGDGSAAVTIEYEVAGVDAGAATEVGLSLLGFGDASTGAVATDLGESIELRASSGTLRTAAITLPPPTAGVSTVVLRYTIERAVTEASGAFHARIPVVSMSLPPVTGSGDVLSIAISLPPGWLVTEGFPTGLTVGSGSEARAGLLVVPSIVTVRGRVDGAWRPGPSSIIELFTVLVLAGLCFLGWRHLRSVAA